MLNRFSLALLLSAGLIAPASAQEGSPTDNVAAEALAAQQKRIDVVNKVAPTVVAIFANGGAGGGSGVLITPDGYALTNFHVTNGSGEFIKCGLNDGVLYDSVIVSIDPTGDVALIKLLGRDDFPFAEMGDSDQVQAGDWAYAMGNPFLLATDFRPTVTYGIVSGVHRYQYPAGTFLEYTDCIQVDTSINPGNSGGPLFNDAGQLIGINGRGSFEKRGRVNSGAGYAISINQIKHFMGHLRSGRIVDHATLGATVTTDGDGRVIIDGILEESAAYRRGLREGDELVFFAGRNLGSVNEFKNILGIYPNGWTLPITYRRDGKKADIYVKLRALHRVSELGGKKAEQPPEGQPKPGEEPKKPGEEPKKPEQPRPMPMPKQEKPKPPEKYKHMYVKKDGFANYYFNELEQQRLLKQIGDWGDFAATGERWKLTGSTADGKSFELVLGQDIGLKQGEDVFFQPLAEGSELLNDPPGSGGLLLAMHQFRTLLTSQGKKFTEFFYLGTEPLDGSGEMVDVLTSVLTGVTTHYYFSQASGAFLGFDTTVAPDADPCSVRFVEFGDLSGKKFPTKFTVTTGGQPYANFHIQSAEWGAK